MDKHEAHAALNDLGEALGKVKDIIRDNPGFGTPDDLIALGKAQRIGLKLWLRLGGTKGPTSLASGTIEANQNLYLADKLAECQGETLRQTTRSTPIPSVRTK